MSVRDRDPLDPVAGSRDHRLEVACVVRPWVDHPTLDDVRVRAVEGERRRVGRPDADHAIGDAVGLIHDRIMARPDRLRLLATAIEEMEWPMT